MKQPKQKKIMLISFFSVIALTLVFLMSPFFAVSDITISGNDRFSDNQILAIAGIEHGTNIFKLKYANAGKKLLENTYIKYADVVTHLPDRLTIEIVERSISGYVPYMGTYLYIDQDGIVLENMPDITEPRPIVTGLKFDEFTIGGMLNVSNRGSFDVVTTIARLLLSYEFIDSVKEINISNPEEIHMYIDNIDVSFGTIDDADKKMRLIKEIIRTIPEGDKGILHVENTAEKPYFSYTL